MICTQQLTENIQFNGYTDKFITYSKKYMNNIKENPMRKYRENQHIENETYQQYIERASRRNSMKDLWIYKLLNDNSHEDILYYDNEFILIKPKKSINTHLLGFVRDISIRTMRDLTDMHIPLLTHIYNKGCKYFKEKYDIDKNKLKVYVHYPPTTWVLHIHFTSIENNKANSSVEYTYSLFDIVNILRIKGDYYQTEILNCLVDVN